MRDIHGTCAEYKWSINIYIYIYRDYEWLDNGDAAWVGTLSTETWGVFCASDEAGRTGSKLVLEAIVLAANSQLVPLPFSLRSIVWYCASSGRVEKGR